MGLPVPADRRLLAALGMPLAAFAVGAAIARSPVLGLSAVAAAVALPLAFLSLPLAVAGCTVLAFVEPSGILGPLPFLATILVVAVWLGTIGSRRAIAAALAARGRPLLGLLIGLLLWCAASALWATDTEAASRALRPLVVAAVLLVVVATMPSRISQVRLLMGAFVIGALVALMVGLAQQGITTSATALESASEGRIAGGAGDPNYLAAGIVPAMVLAAALAATSRNALARLGLLIAVLALAAGLAATQSRGALVALAVTIVTGIALAGGYRAQAVGLAVAMLTAATLVFAASPSGFERVTNFNGGGNGRTELWSIAWAMSQDEPLLGVGLDNFQARSPDYVQRPGSVKYADIIVDDPHVTHNVYLQQLAETGYPGLILLVGVQLACILAGLGAARRFEACGEPAAGLLARAAVVATTGMLAASVFISNTTDKRVWVLLGFGPALLGLAWRERPGTTGAADPATI